MKQIKLSNRLQTIADMLGKPTGVIDVGTDHGYLPVYLAQNGKAKMIAATDIRRGPLARAMVSAEEYGVAGRIEFLLADGLDGIDSGSCDTAEYDTVVIAGMGGETIIRILAKAAWTRSACVKLVLQPQTKQDELTAWLIQNGYSVLDAALARDDNRMYVVFTAAAGSGGGSGDPLDILLAKHDPLLPAYLTELVKKTKRAVEGLEKAAESCRQELARRRRELENYLQMKGETDRWLK